MLYGRQKDVVCLLGYLEQDMLKYNENIGPKLGQESLHKRHVLFSFPPDKEIFESVSVTCYSQQNLDIFSFHQSRASRLQ